MKIVVKDETLKKPVVFNILDGVKIQPPGWHRPFGAQSFNPNTMKIGKMKRYPAQKKAGTVWYGGRGYRMNDVRVVSPEVEAQLDEIDAKIRVLRDEYFALLSEHFLEFRFIELADLPESQHMKGAYATKQEAENAAKVVQKSSSESTSAL